MNFQLAATFAVEHLTADEYRGEPFYSYGTGFHYYHLKKTAGVPALDVLQPDLVQWAEVEAGVALPPHRDHGLTAALNLYIQPAGAVTTFWSVKEGQQPYAYPGRTVANMFRRDQLRICDYFKAEAGQAYWMNLAQVHSVHGGFGKRVFIQFGWSTASLDQVVRLL